MFPLVNNLNRVFPVSHSLYIVGLKLIYSRLTFVSVLWFWEIVFLFLLTNSKWQVSSCAFFGHKPVLLLPSGKTPQRREFVYPRQLVKSRPRNELLESLRRQQEELQAAMEDEEDGELEDDDKQSQVDHIHSLLFVFFCLWFFFFCRQQLHSSLTSPDTVGCKQTLL